MLQHELKLTHNQTTGLSSLGVPGGGGGGPMALIDFGRDQLTLSQLGGKIMSTK